MRWFDIGPWLAFHVMNAYEGEMPSPAVPCCARPPLLSTAGGAERRLLHVPSCDAIMRPALFTVLFTAVQSSIRPDCYFLKEQCSAELLWAAARVNAAMGRMGRLKHTGRCDSWGVHDQVHIDTALLLFLWANPQVVRKSCAARLREGEACGRGGEVAGPQGSGHDGKMCSDEREVC